MVIVVCSDQDLLCSFQIEPLRQTTTVRYFKRTAKLAKVNLLWKKIFIVFHYEFLPSVTHALFFKIMMISQ